MPDPRSKSAPQPFQAAPGDRLADLSDLELAQILAQRLAIKPQDWHRLNSNRYVRAGEQLAAALVFLLKQQPDESLPRLHQATGWLDKTLKAPPCPSHGPSTQHR